MVNGYRAKDDSHLVDTRRVTFPDGRSAVGTATGVDAEGDLAVIAVDTAAMEAKWARLAKHNQIVSMVVLPLSTFRQPS